MKRGKRSKTTTKRGRGKKDTVLYSSGDCVAIRGDSKALDVAVLGQDVKSAETAIKVVPMERVSPGYFLFPRDGSEAWTNVRKVVGTVALERTENPRCFALSREEEARVQRGRDLEPPGEVNIHKIR